jgi:pilus assembly protein CpaB
LLRLAQSNVSEIEPVELSAPSPEVDRNFVPKPDRRKAERRGMDALRDEALRNVISKVEDRNFGGLRTRVHWGRGMKPSRIVLLLVAILAGGLAAFLAMQHEPAAPSITQVAKVQPEARTQILVATEAIGLGQRLTPQSVSWQDWPQGAVRPEYITIQAQPNAVTDLIGSIARYEIFPGEPIGEQKLARDGQGYLSAVLATGMRGVSVQVSAESASGGFIVPNDHVDVVLTSPKSQASETILHNARVLAINTRLGETGKTGAPADPTDPHAEIFAGMAIATLELDPTQAEVITNATSQGKLSLVLRPIVDATQADKVAVSPANAAIRLSSPFWAK